MAENYYTEEERQRAARRRQRLEDRLAQEDGSGSDSSSSSDSESSSSDSDDVQDEETQKRKQILARIKTGSITEEERTREVEKLKQLIKLMAIKEQAQKGSKANSEANSKGNSPRPLSEHGFEDSSNQIPSLSNDHSSNSKLRTSVLALGRQNRASKVSDASVIQIMNAATKGLRKSQLAAIEEKEKQ